MTLPQVDGKMDQFIKDFKQKKHSRDPRKANGKRSRVSKKSQADFFNEASSNNNTPEKRVMNDDSESDVSPYERKRLKNIEDRKRFFEETNQTVSIL